MKKYGLLPKQILRLVPFQKQLNFLFITGLLFPRIWDLQAIFKAALMAVESRYDIGTPDQV